MKVCKWLKPKQLTLKKCQNVILTIVLVRVDLNYAKPVWHTIC